VTIFLQQLVNGLTLGSVYALVALGFTMIFGVLEVIAFAQGGVYMIGAYTGLALVYLTGDMGWLLNLILAATGAAITGALLNVAIDRIAYRPIRGRGRLAPLISGIGMYMFLENGIGLWVGRQVQVFPQVLPATTYSISGIHLTSAQFVIIAVALLCMIALWCLVSRTESGLTMRAVAERPETSSLMGIEPERVIVLTFLVAGALSGVGGVLVAGFVGVVSPSMGFLVGIKAFAAAIIAGVGNIPGALVGGLIVGLTETLGAGYISSAWSDALVFAMLILVLIFRPHGVLGVRLPQRA